MSKIETEPAWAGYLNNAGRAFRLGMEATGSENLTQFIDALQDVLKTLPPEKIPQLSAALNESLTAQSRRDYSYLADLLEYQIRPLLEQ